jgi:hypothetical protein
MRRTLLIGSMATVLALVGLSGCYVRAGVAVPAPALYVNVAPPPPRVEVFGVAPGPDYVWVGGYWNWVEGRHVWVAGRWEHPPHPGYRWVPHEWVRADGGWRLREGHWARG